VPPYAGEYCLKIEWERFVTTSVGLVIEKDAASSLRVALRRAVRRVIPKSADRAPAE
jgi:hypothetical protein